MLPKRGASLFLLLSFFAYAQQELPTVLPMASSAAFAATDLMDDSGQIKSKEEEQQIQLLAIATVANMAQGIINIGNAADNSVVVAQEVAKIMGCFANFVIQAMKNPGLLECLHDEEFSKSISRFIVEKRSRQYECTD